MSATDNHDAALRDYLAARRTSKEMQAMAAGSTDPGDIIAASLASERERSLKFTLDEARAILDEERQAARMADIEARLSDGAGNYTTAEQMEYARYRQNHPAEVSTEDADWQARVQEYHARRARGQNISKYLDVRDALDAGSKMGDGATLPEWAQRLLAKDDRQRDGKVW